MIFQRQDINIADRLQIIGLQKVFDTFGQLGSVIAEGTGKNNFQIQACRQRHFDGLSMLGGAGDAGKICLRMQKIMRFEKALLIQNPTGMIRQCSLVMRAPLPMAGKFGNAAFAVVTFRKRRQAQQTIILPAERNVTAGIKLLDVHILLDALDGVADFLITADDGLTFRCFILQQLQKMLLAAVLQIFFDIGDADIQRTQVDNDFQIQKLLN